MVLLLGRVTALITGASLLWPAAALAGFMLEPGFLYQTSDVGIRQFSPELQLEAVAMPSQVGFSGLVGGAISPDGRFYVFSGYQRGATENGARLFVLDREGAYLRDLPLTNIGLNRASHIAFDHAGRLYVGSPAGLHEFAPDLSAGRILPIPFARVAGVAVDEHDRLFVADQENDVIVMLDQERRPVGAFPTGRVPMGMDFAPDGSLYYTDTPFQSPTSYLGRLVRLDTATGQQSVIFSDLPFVTDIEFVSDGSFYLALSHGRSVARYDALLRRHETFSDGTVGDTINFLELAEIPEPSMAPIGLLASIHLLRRRRAAQDHSQSGRN